MKPKKSKRQFKATQPKPKHARRLPRSSDLGERMTAEQAALLRALARDGYEPEAFSSQLTPHQAAIRIATLKAKLRLQGEPPHTL